MTFEGDVFTYKRRSSLYLSSGLFDQLGLLAQLWSVLKFTLHNMARNGKPQLALQCGIVIRHVGHRHRQRMIKRQRQCNCIPVQAHLTQQKHGGTNAAPFLYELQGILGIVQGGAKGAPGSLEVLLQEMFICILCVYVGRQRGCMQPTGHLVHQLLCFF